MRWPIPAQGAGGGDSASQLLTLLAAPDPERQMKLLLAQQFDDIEAAAMGLDGPNGSVILSGATKAAIRPSGDAPARQAPASPSSTALPTCPSLPPHRTTRLPHHQHPLVHGLGRHHPPRPSLHPRPLVRPGCQPTHNPSDGENGQVITGCRTGQLSLPRKLRLGPQAPQSLVRRWLRSMVQSPRMNR